MVLAVRDGDEVAAGTKDARDLGEPEIDVGDVVEHPRRHDAVERRVAERQRLDISDARVHAARVRELDHSLGDIHRDDVCAQPAGDPLAQLAGAAADLEHVDGLERGDDAQGLVARIGPGGAGVDGPSRLQTGLARVLVANELWVVEPHAAVTIGCPGIPRRGALPPSQALTVAPTSANSPSCRLPSALRPCTYASRSACSREWSVDGVVGSQPWSDVSTNRSPGRSASSRSGSRRSKSCRQRWKLSGSFRWPQSMSVSTRFVKISPSSSLPRSFSVAAIPSTFDLVGCDSSMSTPAKIERATRHAS